MVTVPLQAFIKLDAKCALCNGKLRFSVTNVNEVCVVQADPCESCIETAIEDEKFEPKEQAK